MKNLILKVTLYSLFFTLLTTTASNGFTGVRNDLGFRYSKSRSQFRLSSAQSKDTGNKNSLQAILDDNAQVEKVAGDFQFTVSALSTLGFA